MPALVSRPHYAALCATVLALLSACGGGGSSPATEGGTSGQASLATESAAVAESQQLKAVQSVVFMVAPTSGGAGISVTPPLSKADGSPVTTLEDLPEGISNSTWMKTTGTRLPLRVVLGAGTYLLSKPWTWTPAQSGRADSPVTVEAQTPGSVVISGGKAITVSLATHGGASKVVVDTGAANAGVFEQLWVNDRRVTRARAPNAGEFYYVKKAVGTWGGAATLGEVAVDQQAFQAEPASLAYLSGLSAAEKEAAILVAMHSWTTSHHHIAETNSSNEVRVTPASRWPFLRNAGYQRYFIENIPSALDAPGEWYLQPTTGKLSYLPSATEKTAALRFDVPVLQQLLVLKGQLSAGKWVEHLHFKGITFRYAAANLPAEGWIDNQAAVAIDAAIVLNSARHVSLSACEVSHVGGYAIWLKENVRNASVLGCEVYDTGAGGIKVGLANQGASPTATGYNVIRGNRVHATGFQFPGAVGIWVGQSAYNTIDGNLVGDTTYSAISVGWNWGYVASQAHHNLVTRNFIYDVMQGSLSDGGGIYTLGISPGTEIKGNVIKNVRGYNYYGSGAWGMYNDEGSSNIVMDSNIVTDTDHGGYMLHYGAANVVSNNVFAGGRNSEVQIAKSEAALQATLTGNRFVPTIQSFVGFGDTTTTPLVNFEANRVSRQYVTGASIPAQCGSGCAFAEALRVSSAGKFDVPVVTDAGGTVVLPHPVANSWSAMPPKATPSPAPIWAKSRGFSFDAATADIGSWPMGLKVAPVDRPELVSVMRNGAGEKCLGFQDSGTHANRWEPYAYIDTDYPTGVTTVSFTFKADASTELVHEWRDPLSANGYLTGPSLVLSGARGVVIKNTVVAPLPVGQWVTVTVTAVQGVAPTWQVQLKYADGSQRTVSGQAPVSDTWARTRSFYFISNASVPSTPCIGKWVISNEP